jgi:hypothetical protein
MDERAKRVGLNEAVFREVNERIGDLAQTFALTERPLDLVCECGDATCTQQVRMTYADYERVRDDPRLFAIHPGHEAPGVEDVVERQDGFDVVRKREGVPAQIAESTDPRS